MIKIENLTKKYGTNVAVDHINLTIPDNEVLGFLGPNGAGKSTTMNIITGYISASSGRVMVDQWDILQDPVEARMRIGYLPEIPPLYKELTVWEYLSFAFGIKRCKMEKTPHITEVCRETGLSAVQNRLIGSLSKGYQQRVGIAQALIGDPPILILDEPTVGLDPSQIIEIRNLIRKLKKSHTVILSTHILPEAQLICDRIAVISKGVIVSDGTTEELAHEFSGGTQLEAMIKGDQSEVLAAVRALPGVESVRLRDGKYIIAVQKEHDVREDLFHVLAQKDLPLLGLRENEATLEQLFIQVTDQKVPKAGGKAEQHA